MKIRKTIMVLVLLPLFLNVGYADSNVKTKKIFTKSQKSVHAELFKKLRKADSDIDRYVFDEFVEKATSAEWDNLISISELKEYFWEEIITPKFLEEIHDNPILSNWLEKVSDVDDISKLLKEIVDGQEEVARIKAEADKAWKEADKAWKRADSYKKSRKALGW